MVVGDSTPSKGYKATNGNDWKKERKSIMITAYNLIYEGVDSSSYWSGRGTGNYTHVYTGYGDSVVEAIDDLRDQLAELVDDALDELFTDAAKDPDKHTSCHEECYRNWKQENFSYDEDGDGILEELDPNGNVIDWDELWGNYHESCELAHRVSLQYDTNHQD